MVPILAELSRLDCKIKKNNKIIIIIIIIIIIMIMIIMMMMMIKSKVHIKKYKSTYLLLHYTLNKKYPKKVS